MHLSIVSKPTQRFFFILSLPCIVTINRMCGCDLLRCRGLPNGELLANPNVWMICCDIAELCLMLTSFLLPWLPLLEYNGLLL